MELADKYREMFQNIKAVIFDMDGTLIDSMYIWREIDVEFLASRGLPMQDNLQKCIEGKSFHETAIFFKDTFNLTESLDEIKDIWNNMAYKKYSKEIQLKKGAMDLLWYCRQNDIRLGIATSNSSRLTRACLDNLGVMGFFDTVVTGCDITNGKPKPDIYLKAADNLGVNPSDCLVFEDIVKGIMAGVNAGMRTCAVYDAYSADTDKEKRTLADYYIDDFDRIID